MILHTYTEKNYPLAWNLESTVNVFASTSSILEKILTLFDSKKKTEDFFNACVFFWGQEDTHYDERNERAVLLCREMRLQFPDIERKAEKTDEYLLINALAFTQFAHRYLQSQLFKAIVLFHENQNNKLWEWLKTK